MAALSVDSTPAEIVQVLLQVHATQQQQQQQLQTLLQQQQQQTQEMHAQRALISQIQNNQQQLVDAQAKQGQQLLDAQTKQNREKDKKGDMVGWKSFPQVPKFNGDETAFMNYEFKLQNFVRPEGEFEEFLEFIKELDEEPKLETITEKNDKELEDILWYDDQLYAILTASCEDAALGTVKNVRECKGYRGSLAWYRLTRDVASKSGVRLERLADKVHHPKPITSYATAEAELRAWDTMVKELAKMEGQQISDLTKRTTLKKMVPADLVRDLERDRSLKTWEQAWNFVLEQVPLRKHWPTSTKKKGPNDMDIDAAEEENKSEDEDKTKCPPCNGSGSDQDLDTLKGNGSNVFQGYCGWCNRWGHKRADCRQRLASLNPGEPGKGGKEQAKGADKGKGKGKTDGGTGWYNGQGGGWQGKGGKSYGKAYGKGGWQQKGKGGFNGIMANIDGDFSSWDSWGANPYGGGSFFGSLMSLDEDDTSETDALDQNAFDQEDDPDTENVPLCAAPEPLEGAKKPSRPTFATLTDLCQWYKEHPELNVVTSTVPVFPSIPSTTPSKTPAKEDGATMSPYASCSMTNVVTSPSTAQTLREAIPGEDPSPRPVDLKDVFDAECGLQLADDFGEAEDLWPENSEGNDDPFDDSPPDVRVAGVSLEGENGIVQATTEVGLCIACGGTKWLLDDVVACPLCDAEDAHATSEPEPANTVEAHAPEVQSAFRKRVSRAKRNGQTGHRSRKKLRKVNAWVKTRAANAKKFEDQTVSDLKQMFEESGLNFEGSEADDDHSCTSPSEISSSCSPPPDLHISTLLHKTAAVEGCWYDEPEQVEGVKSLVGSKDKDEEVMLWEDSEDERADKGTQEIMNLSWRSAPEEWDGAKWVKVDSVVDSGAAAPVAPPDMLPGVKIVPSPGSLRGQKYTSASKHKLKNLGQQHIQACTEEGENTSVLFQIADVSKPLVSVGSICEKGNRVIFGRSGGVVKNLQSGSEIPFYRRNGIYVLSLWLRDADSQGFTRP